MSRCLAAVIIAILAGAATAAQNEPSLAPATFLPQWTPQAQFAGFYIAFEKGLYRQQGIDLTILTGGPDRSASQSLQDAQADFVTLWLSTAIQMRARGVPVVNVAQLVQRSALMLVAKKSSGIRTPADLAGKKVAVWDGDFRLQPEAFFKKFGVKVQTVPLGPSINLFLRDGVVAATAMWYNEYYTLLSSGLNADEITTFFFDAYDLNFPEDGIYCLQETRSKRPQLVEGFVRATWDGWAYAFAHPDEAIDITMRYMAAAHVPANRVHQRWMLARMRDLMMRKEGEAAPTATLARGDYERVALQLQESGWIDRIPMFTSFYQPPPGT